MHPQSLPDQISHLHYAVPLPQMIRVRQHFDVERVTDIEGDVARAIQSFAGRLRPQMRVAVGVGSRGIADLPHLVRAVGAELRRLGVEPFIIPAMGSHGGATAEGQRDMLADLGVTEAAMGMPVVSSMDVHEVERLEDGTPVYWSADALAADAVIPIARIKPHTDFRGPIESGPAKMLAIGLGKQRGAANIHRHGPIGLMEIMPRMARFVVGLGKVAGAVAVLENAYDELARIVGIPPDGIAGPLERELQAASKTMMPSLPFDRFDALIIDEMGKNISGAGMDPNIIGRMEVFGVPEFQRPKIATIAVLGLTEVSHGNATGIGLANFTTQRLYDTVNFEHTYINGITSGITGIQRCQLPIIMPTDQDAISAAILTSGRSDPVQATVVRIPNTLKLGELEISATLLDEARQNPRLEVVGAPHPMAFDHDGRIAPFSRP